MKRFLMAGFSVSSKAYTLDTKNRHKVGFFVPLLLVRKEVVAVGGVQLVPISPLQRH